MGGDEPARTLIAAALGDGQAGRDRQQARHRPPRPGARGDRPADRRGAPLRGGGRRRDPGPRAARRGPRRPTASTRVRGIVNGTTNFILTAMTDERPPTTTTALAEAQAARLRGGRPDRRRRGPRRGQQARHPGPARVRRAGSIRPRSRRRPPTARRRRPAGHHRRSTDAEHGGGRGALGLIDQAPRDRAPTRRRRSRVGPADGACRLDSRARPDRRRHEPDRDRRRCRSASSASTGPAPAAPRPRQRGPRRPASRSPAGWARPGARGRRRRAPVRRRRSRVPTATSSRRASGVRYADR